MRTLAAVAVIAAGALSLAGLAGASAKKETLQGAGSTFVAPLVAQWQAHYSKADINYSAIGSGAGIAQIAAQYGIAHEALKHDWMQAPDLAKIAERLDADKAFTHVAVIHHETTTGRLNDLAALGALCRARGLRLRHSWPCNARWRT
jgi:2-aminoethylphosphonate-pyruvate transaminase